MGFIRNFRMRRRLQRALRDFEGRTFTPKPHGLKKPLYVSLTSYAARFDVLHLTLRGLLTQTVQPDAVVLWLGEADMAAVPQAVLAMQSERFEIRATKDMRAYTKLIPMLMAAPEAYIITADDDVFYRADWLEGLVTTAIAHPRDVVAHRAHRVTYTSDGALKSYEKWQLDIAGAEAGRDIFPTGVGGVLYPPGSLHPDTTNIALFQELSPFNDDIWAYWMASRQGNVVRHVGPRCPVIEWPESQKQNLRSVNRGVAGQSGNDRAIAAMVARFGRP